MLKVVQLRCTKMQFAAVIEPLFNILLKRSNGMSRRTLMGICETSCENTGWRVPTESDRTRISRKAGTFPATTNSNYISTGLTSKSN